MHVPLCSTKTGEFVNIAWDGPLLADVLKATQLPSVSAEQWRASVVQQEETQGVRDLLLRFEWFVNRDPKAVVQSAKEGNAVTPEQIYSFVRNVFDN